MPYDLVQYEEEKASGRRRANGALKLTKLTGKHLRMIALHCSGMKAREIQIVMNVTPAWISTVLNDPLAQAEIHKRFVELDNETFAQACGVVTDSLTDDDHALRLRAADMVWRARGRYEKRVDDRPTAEDVVRKMLELAGAAEGARVSLTAEVRRPGPTRDPLIDGMLE